MNYKHLNYEERLFLSVLLNQQYNLKDIARELNRSSATISREVKRNRVGGDKNSLNCPLIQRFPYICKNCKKNIACKFNKIYYNPTKANNKYNYRLSKSRTGIDMTLDEVEYWDEVFRDRIRQKGQSTIHLFNSINFPKSLPTFYSYVKKGIFPSIHEEMLPRMYKYKPRNKSKNKEFYIHENNPVKKYRTFEHFLKFAEKYPNKNIVEMDTVVGKRDDERCLLTLYFRKSKLMLLFLVDHYSTESITNVFDDLKNRLGLDLFKELFAIILTDNGWEFSKPNDIEIDYSTGEKLVNVFYCDSAKSWQKGQVERNHEFIRYIIPKGISFDTLTKKNVIDMTNHINNTYRASIKNTPFCSFRDHFSEDILPLLSLEFIPKNKVDLTYNILK